MLLGKFSLLKNGQVLNKYSGHLVTPRATLDLYNRPPPPPFFRLFQLKQTTFVEQKDKSVIQRSCVTQDDDDNDNAAATIWCYVLAASKLEQVLSCQNIIFVAQCDRWRLRTFQGKKSLASLRSSVRLCVSL